MKGKLKTQKKEGQIHATIIPILEKSLITPLDQISFIGGLFFSKVGISDLGEKNSVTRFPK